MISDCSVDYLLTLIGNHKKAIPGIDEVGMAFFVVCLLLFGRLCSVSFWKGYSLTGSAGLSLDAVSVTTVSLTIAVGALSSVLTGSSLLVTVSFTTVSLTIAVAFFHNRLL